MNVEDPKIEVDHINQNKLDNRKSNLRLCSHSQNGINKYKQSNNSSGFKGVCFNKRRQKFMAFINKDKKRTYIGYFETAEEAGKAYDKKAKELFGEFACLNF